MKKTSKIADTDDKENKF